MDTVKQFSAARRVSVPLIIWKSPDAAATISGVVGAADYPIISWDIVRGCLPCNEKAKGLIKPDVGIGNPLEMLQAAQTLPPDSVVFMHNAHLFTDNSGVIQGIWNLRDTNKADHKTLVLLSPQMKSPIELANDIMVIDEQLPDDGALAEIVKTQTGFARIGAKESGAKFNEPNIDKAVDALSGLSAFSAEQTVAVSFEKNGNGVELNQKTLWDKKRQAIEETRGLTVWRDGETLDDVKGCENIKKFLRRIIDGKAPPRAVVFVDEIEKSLAGSAGDTSGTSQDQLGVLLTEMQNKKAQGILEVGHAGSAKSMVAKAFGNTAGIVTIQMDLGAMKGSLVGDSEKNIRAAMKVIDAVSQGRALYIATCNAIDSLPAALRRRFTLGTFFFDLPTLDERAAIWNFYLKKFGLKEKFGKFGFDDTGWTGADIENCCKRAWMFDCTVAEASKYATPICKTDPTGIENLRNIADNAFISANYEGMYQKGKETVSLEPKQRKMKFE